MNVERNLDSIETSIYPQSCAVMLFSCCNLLHAKSKL